MRIAIASPSFKGFCKALIITDETDVSYPHNWVDTDSLLLPSGCVCNINLQVWNTSNLTMVLYLINNIIEGYDTAKMIMLGLISCKVDLIKLASQCPVSASPMSKQWIIGS